jgi:allophanate hydrolase subunit 1
MKIITRIIQESQGLDHSLFEMANLEPEETGLDYLVWIGTPPASHGPQVKVVFKPGKVSFENSFSISIEDEPKVVAGKAAISSKSLNQIVQWIKANKEALLKHSEQEITDRQFRALLKAPVTENLAEMANLTPKTTGFSHYIWVGPPPASHGHRVKVVNEPGRIDPENSFSISIEDQPKIVAGTAGIPKKELNSIIEWVRLNKDILLRHARMEIDDDELKAGLQSIKKQVTESSRARVLQHVSKHDCGFVTAYRGWIYPDGVEHKEENRLNLDKRTNQARNLQLLGYLHNRGYGVTSVKGGYIEGFGSSEAKIVSEHSFFVVDIKDKGNLKRDLKEFGNKYFQDSILFIPKAEVTSSGEQVKAILIGTSPRKDIPEDFFIKPGVEKMIGSFKSQQSQTDSEIFTAIRNSPFRFESLSREFQMERKYSASSRGYTIYMSLNPEIVKSTIEEKPQAFEDFS